MDTLADEVAIENARNSVYIEELQSQVKILQERMLQAAKLIELMTITIADQREKSEKVALAVVNLQLKVKEMSK